MSIPAVPSEKGFFNAQEGYSNVKIKTQKYHDEPTPLYAQQGAASDFMASHMDKQHQKDYVKKGGKMLFGFLLSFVCR